MSKRRPNIIFVLTDDQGYGDLGCTGDPVLKTPAIDAFAAESIRFTNYHVGPTCAPTRSGIMTGHYANSTGVWHTVGGRSLLRGNETTIADIFAENGYRTGLFGKWHLGDNYPYRPEDRGFHEVITHGGGGIANTPDYWGNDYFDDTYRANGEMKKFDGYCTDVWFSEAMQFIERNKKDPFLCFITPNAPHTPYNVDPKYRDMYRGKVPTGRDSFYGMITNIDENFALLREHIRALGIEDDTILVFTTDNGTGCHISGGNNAGLRGMKGSEYDGGHRVPFFIRWPSGGFTQARDIDTLTANIDILPTFMDLAGIDTAKYDRLNFHGESVKPLLTGEKTGSRERVIVTDSQRLTQPVKWKQSSVMTDRWRLINGRELYAMESDRAQAYDIAEKYPDVVARLRSEYERWWDIVSKQFDEEIPIPIGTDGSEVCLTCHDIRAETGHIAYNQGLVRQGKGGTGHFEIMVERSGTYRIELRRWPKELGNGVTDTAMNADYCIDAVPENERYQYEGGTALPFVYASLTIGSRTHTMEVKQNSPSAVFDAALQEGSTHLDARFIASESLVRGAYYVYVSWKKSIK
ncbi:MAG: arylsulfatase [Spirochaetota bacterium]